MNANRLVFPNAGASAVVGEVRRYGTLRLETGGFFLAPRGTERITCIACAGNTGIVRRPELFQIGERALDCLFAYAEARDLWIPAQFHSHMFDAGLSRCDLEHGFSVEGFHTTVVPFFHAPPSHPARWGWWRYRSAWEPVNAPESSAAAVQACYFDEGGVRDA